MGLNGRLREAKQVIGPGLNRGFVWDRLRTGADHAHPKYYPAQVSDMIVSQEPVTDLPTFAPLFSGTHYWMTYYTMILDWRREKTLKSEAPDFSLPYQNMWFIFSGFLRTSANFFHWASTKFQIRGLNTTLMRRAIIRVTADHIVYHAGARKSLTCSITIPWTTIFRSVRNRRALIRKIMSDCYLASQCWACKNGPHENRKHPSHPPSSCKRKNRSAPVQALSCNHLPRLQYNV